MKTIATRIRLEKQFWLEMSKMVNRLGYSCKWDVAGQLVSRQKVWNRIDRAHHSKQPAYYGFLVTLGRIGNHDLQLCLEMQDDLKMGLRFREGFPYWTESEIESWGELTLRLDSSGKWCFDAMGWFASQKLPVRLNFTEETNPALLDMAYYKADSHARLLLSDELINTILQVRTACAIPIPKSVWSL